ncbi:DNA polymerase III subunit chi [Psychrobacter sp. TB55-MNA-CIBAN-0194]|uniref:DNA polymerase III subunit chi n=1 Tax=Psychrobacter sp. TB55-MNA-CIBAN-0194 TaxID=3140445 RepID=UPI00332924AF
MKISFYVLSESKAQDFLGFICQLTQTALNKSTQSLLILVEDDALLSMLDEALWAQETTSFIPHQCLLDTGTQGTDPEGTDVDAATANTDNVSLAPVLLGNYMPADFKGIVLNTTIRPVNTFMAATSNAQPTRVLELIKPDATSVQEGRNKYKAYQQLGYELTHFKV